MSLWPGYWTVLTSMIESCTIRFEGRGVYVTFAGTSVEENLWALQDTRAVLRVLFSRPNRATTRLHKTHIGAFDEEVALKGGGIDLERGKVT